MLEKHKRRGINFCWVCGKKLWEPYFDIVIIDNLDRICHKCCAKELREDPEYINRISNLEKKK